MGKLLPFPDIKPREALAPLDWQKTLQDMRPHSHVSKSQGRLQSPHHPNVFIELNYGQPPAFHGADGSVFYPDAVELGRYMLEWMCHPCN